MGMKIFITGITVAVCVAAFNIPLVILIVAAVLCIIGCILAWLDK